MCKRHLICIAQVFCLAVPIAAQQSIDVAGLSESKPEKGRSVKTAQGYMAEYKMTIPGTDITYEMVPIAGGTFTMGSPAGEEGRLEDEGPQRQVTIEPFWMGKFEITWAEYKAFMELYRDFKSFESKKLRRVTKENELDAITAPTPLYDPSFTYKFGEEPRQPAVTMTQYAAKQYTKWLSGITSRQYRLPSEAEWEYACRAGGSTPFSFGDDPDRLGEYAWFYENADEHYHDVGQKKPNPWGLYDMHGNVWEWCLDAYSEKGYKESGGKTLSVQNSIAWPDEEFPRTVRGGSWDDDPEQCRSASRMASDVEWKMMDPNLPLSPWWFTSDPARGVGFRIIRPLKKMDRKAMEKFWVSDVSDIRRNVRDRLEEGRGVRGIVDPDLPKAIKQLKN